MSSGGGGGGGDSETTIRYAGYIERAHEDFLDTIAETRASVITDSPFSDYTNVDVDSAFFGTGYAISSFPALYDMFGKFMAGLDIEILWSQSFEDTLNYLVVPNLIDAESALLSEELEETAIPRMEIGLRDISSVLTSTFVIGREQLENSRQKQLAKFSAELKYNLIPIAHDRWKAHLDWNKGVIGVYAEMMKLYFSAKTDVDEVNYAMAAKNKLWPFTVLDFERAALGALQGAVNQKTDVAGASTASRVLSGALSGAAMGAMIGGQITQTAAVPASQGVAAVPATTYAGWGAGIGAALGIASAYTY